jgi:hypothetical protein
MLLAQVVLIIKALENFRPYKRIFLTFPELMGCIERSGSQI